jgi:hypothetical protein
MRRGEAGPGWIGIFSLILTYALWPSLPGLLPPPMRLGMVFYLWLGPLLQWGYRLWATRRWQLEE